MGNETMRALMRLCLLVLFWRSVFGTSTGQDDGEEGFVPCFQGFQPGYFQDITSAESAWALNQNSKTCGTVEDILLQPNLTKKFDPGAFLLFNANCDLTSSYLYRSGKSSQCQLSFDVLMWDESAQKSSLDFQIAYSGSTANRRWSNDSGQSLQDSDWSTVNVDLNDLQQLPFEMKFNAQVGSLGGVALDTVRFTHCCLTRCQRSVFFESGWHGWSNAVTGDTLDPRWRRVSASAHSTNTGPPVDALNQRLGHYLYLKCNGENQGKISTLSSSIMANRAQSGDQDCRITFRYYLPSKSVGYLTISLESMDDGQTPVVSKEVNATTESTIWRTAEPIYVSSAIKQFRIKIVGVCSSGADGGIGIDHVTFSDHCSCPEAQSATVQPTLNPTTGDMLSTECPTDGYTAAVIVLSIAVGGLVTFIAIHLYSRRVNSSPRKSSSAKSLKNDQKSASALSRRLSRFGVPLDDAAAETISAGIVLSRSASKASWQVDTCTSTSGVDFSLDTATTTTERLELTPSLLDLVEMESGHDGLVQ